MQHRAKNEDDTPNAHSLIFYPAFHRPKNARLLCLRVHLFYLTLIDQGGLNIRAMLTPPRVLSQALPAQETWMRLAMAEADKVQGSTGDNPAVGCVLVGRGRLLGAGGTAPSGGPHAEALAVQNATRAGHMLKGCCVYVTLEPCCFTGRTPPCSQLLVSIVPKRVVIGLIDPHPKVNGKGIAALKAAGIEVEVGVLEKPIAQQMLSWLARFSPA